MLAPNLVDYGFNPPVLSTPKTIRLVFAASLPCTALRSKRKAWLTRKQDNVSEWRDLSTHCLLFHKA